MESQATQRFILLTDIAGSSRLAERYPEPYAAALDNHNAMVAQAVAAAAGELYKHTGDGCLALFDSAGAAVNCAHGLAQSFASLPPLAADSALQVRIALHGGELRRAGAEYFGPALNRASRICQVCHPGQVLLSSAVQRLTPGLPAGARLLDLGLHHLRDLSEPEQLFQLCAAGLAGGEFPPLATLDNRPNNLERQPNRFVGRERELAELDELLHSGISLLTLTAPGGYGKSRLAAQLCANLLPHFERGVFMVYLAPVRDSHDVAASIARALGYQFTAGREPQQELCDYLRSKELLLCLDNFEHMLSAAPLAAELLRAAPQLKLLVTSREPLRIKEECIYRLEPLPVGAADAEQYSDAQRLFADRAALVNTDFALSAATAAPIADICGQLSGIPLAIELAAAWLDGFTLSELRTELSHQLELTARHSDLPERHRSLKASLDWSWSLLGPAQQELLMRLSVFRGGCFSEAASAVLGLSGMALRSALLKLCDKSWLYTREVDGQTRFYLRDMLSHEYAAVKLAEQPADEGALSDQAARAHAAYYTALVQREGPRLSGGGSADGGAVQRLALRSWRLEMENINGALETSLRLGEAGWLMQISRHLRHYLEMTGAFFQQRERYSLLLTAARQLGDPALLAHAQLGLGAAHASLGRYSVAQALFEQALAQFRSAGDRQAEAATLSKLSLRSFDQGDYARVAESQQQALAIFRELGDCAGEAASLRGLAIARIEQGDYSGAAELLTAALKLRRATGDRKGEAWTLSNLAIVHYSQGDYARAAELQQQALAICRELGDRRGEALCLANLSTVFVAQDDFARGEELQSAALAVRRELGERRGEAYSLLNLANISFVQDDYLGAARLQYAGLAIARDGGFKVNQAVACLGASAILFSLGAPRAAVTAIFGGLAQAAALNYHFPPSTMHQVDSARRRVDEAVERGVIESAEVSALQARAEALSSDELADEVLAALAQCQPAAAGAD